MTRRAAAIAAAIAGVATTASLGCRSPIDADRLERAIAPTFANLVHLQLARSGLTPLAASDIHVTASCRKLVAATGASGSGDWVCTVAWRGPNGTGVLDTYDVSVATDGCYTATADEAASHIGGPLLTGADGRLVRNLLYSFEGCFDPT
jgi:hypothetical protein